jgi:hypothetical protein
MGKTYRIKRCACSPHQLVAFNAAYREPVRYIPEYRRIKDADFGQYERDPAPQGHSMGQRIRSLGISDLPGIGGLKKRAYPQECRFTAAVRPHKSINPLVKGKGAIAQRGFAAIPF